MNITAYKNIILPGLLSLLLCSCTEVINIDLNSANPVIVAEGYMEPDSAASLRLTNTTDYYNMEAAQVIEDAKVVINDQSGASEEMIYRGNGIYTGEQVKGSVHYNYAVTIEVDGKTYSGSSGLLPPADIASITYSELLLGNPEMSELLGYTLNVAFDAIPDQDSYYALKIKKNGFDAANTYGLASTRINDEGNYEYASRSFFVMPGDTIDMTVYTIDFDAYTFYSEVNEGLSGNLILSPAPFNAGSNLGEDILGYFMARSRIDTVFVVPTLP